LYNLSAWTYPKYIHICTEKGPGISALSDAEDFRSIRLIYIDSEGIFTGKFTYVDTVLVG